MKFVEALTKFDAGDRVSAVDRVAELQNLLEPA